MRHPVDRYVNRLLRRRRPKPFAPTQDELAVMRTAIDLMGAAPDAHGPRPAFVEQLRDRLAEQERAEQGTEAAAPAWRTPARRRFLTAGALTAAGAAAGVGADRMVVIASGADQNGRPGQPGPQQQPAPGELTPTAGVWRDVAASTDLAEGEVRPFDLGAVTGFLRRASGRVQAVSGICTHQGCRLDLAAARDKLSCPCHGATFTVAGVNLTHPRQSSGPLPALPRLPVREQGGVIQVYAPASSPSDQG